jgi:hypothetical protein
LSIRVKRDIPDIPACPIPDTPRIRAGIRLRHQQAMVRLQLPEGMHRSLVAARPAVEAAGATLLVAEAAVVAGVTSKLS